MQYYELEPYRYDPVGFFEDHLGITPHAGQRRFLEEAFKFNDDGHLIYKYPNLTASNRWGKTVVVSGVHLWFAMFKHGLYLSGTSWLHHRYGIINLCPLVDLANVTRDMVNDILMNRAKEQINNVDGRGFCDLGVFFERSDNGYLVNFGKDYKGFRTNLTNVTMEYRTTDDNAKAVQGTPKFLITFDEAGRQKNFLNLIGAHVNPRTLDTDGIIFTATTPDVDTGNDYEEWWNKGDPENGFRDRHFYSMNGSIFDNPHITKAMVDDLLAGTPDYLVDQVLYGKFVQAADAFFGKPSIDKAFKEDLKPTDQRLSGHFYVIAADLAVAEAGDRSVFAIIDATRVPYRVVRMVFPNKGTTHPVLINDLKALLEYYNSEWENPLTGKKESCSAELVYDSTGMGGKMFRDELSTLTPFPFGYDFGGTTKKKLEILASLRLVLDKNGLEIPSTYIDVKQELRNYKRTDAKLNTDSVMALSLGIYRAERSTPVQIDTSAFSGVYN
jgi:hypothetical protein